MEKAQPQLSDRKKIRRATALHRIGIRITVFFFRFLILTLRLRLTPRAWEFIASKPTSCLFLIWHNRMLLSLSAFSRLGKGISLTALVSASGDGAFVQEVIHAFGLQSARGSSSRRAVEATRKLLAALESGRNVVITPDGPRGPIYTFKENAVEVGRRHAKAIYVLGINCNSMWQTKSWDKFMVPKPFAKMEIDVEKIDMTVEYSAELLKSKLLAMNE